jgi:REP element-mobilizing transposase RayT
MARPLRIEFAGALYHVTSRGNRRADIFLDDQDHDRFLAGLRSVIERYRWLCSAYCLMDNHYHLLIETPAANLSQGMRQLNSVYTQAFNRRHGGVGHVLQGRYKAILVEADAYLLELARYIVLNPVRAGMVRGAGDWPWSSYRATAGDGADDGAGDRAAPSWLALDKLLAMFGAGDARAAYRRFVADGRGDTASPLTAGLAAALTGGSVLGGPGFAADIAIKAGRTGGEVVRAQRHLGRPGLAELQSGTADRAWMAVAHRRHGYTMSEIAAAAGLHYSTVSKIIKALEARNS